MPVDPDIQALRESIENLDREIIALIRRRMEVADEVGLVKLDAASPFRDQEREDRLLQAIRREAAEQGLDAHQIERIYRVLLAMSVARQYENIRSLPTAPLRVAYQGVEGSYSHLAAQQRYAGREGGVLLTGCATFRQAVEAVDQGEADLALLPIENTTAGSINETYDLLAEGAVTIIGEVVANVEHCLLALPGTRLDELRTVLSHPQGLLQCEKFLLALPDVESHAEFDTAGSARKVRESGDRTLAAIASETAARFYGLEVLARGIQSESGNYTRFVEVAREAAPCPPDAPCKTSLMLSLAHRPGALGEVLNEFARRGVNLSKLESRPVPGGPFQYRFYLDFDSHADSAPVVAALAAVEHLTSGVRVLGTYPATTDPLPEEPISEVSEGAANPSHQDPGTEGKTP